MAPKEIDVRDRDVVVPEDMIATGVHGHGHRDAARTGRRPGLSGSSASCPHRIGGPALLAFRVEGVLATDTLDKGVSTVSRSDNCPGARVLNFEITRFTQRTPPASPPGLRHHQFSLDYLPHQIGHFLGGPSVASISSTRWQYSTASTKITSRASLQVLPYLFGRVTLFQPGFQPVEPSEDYRIG